uniref:Uncharacterized protein n=1 Tax=Panagrolaimus davidi TaxID=227884 RepID=A0A914R5I0_9BILA
MKEEDNIQDLNDENENEEIVLFERNEEREEEIQFTPMEKMDAAAKRFGEGMVEKFLDFSKHPDATEKSASLCCDLFLQIAEEMTDIFKPFLQPQDLSNIKETVKNHLLPMTSNFRRKQHIEKLGLYISPEMHTVNYEHYTAGTVNGLQLRERRQNIAMFSIKKTLLAVLQNPEIADALVMPSDYTNSNKMNHPFCGSRAQKIYNDTGEDYLAIALNLDEFTATCPIGKTAKIYKMVACYIKLLNFPQDLLSKLNHIFTCFVAHSSDVMANLQMQLERSLIIELRKLETEGIYFTYKGTRRQFKVILLNFVADNLGLHQLNGLQISFSGNNPCRMCRVTAVNLKGQNELNMDIQKTREYDRIVADGNIDEMHNYGIDVRCVFNQLNHFHCMENVTADIMHDILEGHLQVAIPLVIRDAVAHGFSLTTINNAINSFGFIGSDNENPPRPIFLPDRVPDSGDSFKQTAHTAHILVKLLPLIFHFAGIRFEAKHRNSMGYAKVNRCHKNLPMTLATKSAVIFASTLYQMRRGNYLSDLRRCRSQGKYKRGYAVVYGQNETTKQPIFGKIQSLTPENLLNLQCLQVMEFHEISHCYKIQETAQSIQVSVDSLRCSEPLSIYCRNENFIRLNYHLL